MSVVSLVNIKDSNSLEQALKTSLSLIDFDFDSSIKKIVIKPNMCYYWDYSTGHTTDPTFVGSIIKIIRDNLPNAEISVVEADASAMKCKYAFKVLGYEKLSKEYDVKLVNLSEDEVEDTKIRVNGHDFKLKVPNVIKSSDLRINVPKPKYMDKTIITGSLKNIFGCNPEPLKFKLHPLLDEAIVAINKIMNFNLNILDGVIATGATTRKLNLIMASLDPVSFDSTIAKIMSENPKKIRHLKIAEKQGLGKIDCQTKGAPISYFQKLYPKRKASTKFLIKGYKIAIKTGLIKTDFL